MAINDGATSEKATSRYHASWALSLYVISHVTSKRLGEEPVETYLPASDHHN